MNGETTPRPPAPVFALSLRPDVSVDEGAGGRTVFGRAGRSLGVRGVHAAVSDALRSLRSRWSTPESLAGEVFAGGGDVGDAAGLAHVIEALDRRLFLRRALLTGDRALLTVEAISGDFGFDLRRIPRAGWYRLSRFAYCRRHHDDFVLESPLSRARMIIQEPAVAALVGLLARPATAAELAGRIDALDAESAESVLAVLVACGFAGASAGDAALDREDTALRQWEFHDLLFHSRSRRGWHDYPVGAHLRFRGELEPLPAVKPLVEGERIDLGAERMASSRCHADSSLQAVLERRSSIRAYGEPLALEQIGEFLYRSARVRGIRPRDDAAGHLYEESSRPYPSGGAAYDLEIYLSIGRCHGLRPGVYHYDPLGHRLTLVNGDPAYVRRLLDDASVSAGRVVIPDVLITLTSRFQRLSWKYDAIAYATTLKNVGALYQTMYLVATDMELAPCALGGGDSALVAEAMGLDPLVEGSVGEFMLGSRAPRAAAGGAPR
jgi:SagB-type dehydrogenase family enzyme